MDGIIAGNGISRRTILKTLASGAAITVTVRGVSGLAMAASSQSAGGARAPGWAPAAGAARWRVDGMQKVTGQKVYARDFRARDMAGWPTGERMVLAVRVARDDRIFERIDLSMLPPALQPISVIDAARLAADSISLSGSMKKPFFVEAGAGVAYRGQPAALLIFRDFDSWRRAAKILRFNDDVVVYGADTTPPVPAPYSPEYTYVRDGSAFNKVQNGGDPDYDKQLPLVEAAIKTEWKARGWKSWSETFKTQTMDPMFMEPEAGLAWFDGAASRLNLVLGTQSPSGDIDDVAKIFADPNCPYQITEVDLTACYPGGGFGGRDESYFTMYLALASVYANGPVRWAFDRFEQFQIGLKRHQTDFTETILLDSAGKIQGLDVDFVMNGGGRQNLSPYVSGLAAMSAWCGYEIPKAIARGKAMDHPTLIGGSQRGFGGPQAFIAIETLLDRAARDLKVDPIDLRRRNLARMGGTTITGAPIQQDLQLEEILEKSEAHPLWRNRIGDQNDWARKGMRYGVGFALSNQAYGTSGDGMFGAVEIEVDGSLTVISNYVDMGNGSATALGLSTADALGANAHGIRMGDAAYFNALGLSTDSAKSDTYVVKTSGSSSACLCAFYQVHAVSQAAGVLCRESVLPAAAALWGVSGVSSADVTWRDGQLTAPGRTTLAWNAIVAKLRERKSPTSAAVHASFIGGFITGDFQIGGTSQTLPLDYVAFGLAGAVPKGIPRANVSAPTGEAWRFGRSTYAPCGNVAAVTVDPASGRVQVTGMVTVLSAGHLISPDIVSGQSQGGVAMSIGYTLLEDCPNGYDGPSNGRWNLDRYKIARMSDVPLDQELIVLDPARNETTARGIAEAVMCSVSPAILNALAMATGKDFAKMPVTPRDVLEALA